jgi:hypothetical protein
VLLAPLNTLAHSLAGFSAGLLLHGAVWAQALPNVQATPAAANAPQSASSAAPVKAQGNWKELSPPQQTALQPLAPHWSKLSEAQRKKWLTISKNFDKLPEDEKSTLHSRMAEWATLTPQQRIQARLNFGETNRMPQIEKKVQWEGYQSLPEEEKRKLGAAQQGPVMGAALAPKPVAQDKLLHVQTPQGQLPTKGKTPGVKDLDQKTLLPASKVTTPKAEAGAT